MLQPLQALKQRSLDNVAGLLDVVQQSGGLIGAPVIERVRDKRRQNVEEQPDNMTVEEFGDLVDGSQTYAVSRCSIQPNHHVLDHSDLAFRQRATIRPRVRSRITP